MVGASACSSYRYLSYPPVPWLRPQPNLKLALFNPQLTEYNIRRLVWPNHRPLIRVPGHDGLGFRVCI